MDNEKFKNEQEDSAWLDELFGAVEHSAELTVDEAAMDSHDMGQISDRELDEIMKEALSDDWNIEDFEPVFDDPEPVAEHRDEYADNGEAVEEYAEDDQDEEPVDPDAPVRKVRPRRKKGYGLFGIPHLAATAIWLAIAVLIGFSLGRLVWVCAADVLAFGRPDQNITITITQEDTVESVTDKLFDAGLIKYKELFKLYAELANADEKISAGTFTLNTQYDYHALVNGLRASSTDRKTVTVVIPEGYTCAQIFALLEKEGVSTVQILEDYAATSEFASYDFLEGVERGSKYCLEGFLFPDTYQFYENDTPQRIFDKFLSRFDDQVDEELLVYLNSLNETMAAKMRKHGYSTSYIEQNKMTLYKVITMASIVQKESAHSGENYDIASVFYNRLANAGNFPYLNSDATVVYAHGGNKENLDYGIDSPYNTYKVKGLPIGPIANPGLSAIMASLSPAETDYYYFVLDPSIGEHLFAETYKQHQDNVNSVG